MVFTLHIMVMRATPQQVKELRKGQEPMTPPNTQSDDDVTVTIPMPRRLRAKTKAWAAMHDLTMEAAIVSAVDKAYGHVQLAPAKDAP
jgi:hypothetical protein